MFDDPVNSKDNPKAYINTKIESSFIPSQGVLVNLPRILEVWPGWCW